MSGSRLDLGLTAMLADNVAARPGAVAVTGPDAQGREVSLTYRELEVRAADLAGGLRRLGLGEQPGDVLAVWLPNLVDHLVIEFAAARLGIIVVAVNTRYRSADLVALLRRSRARGIVTAARFLGVDHPAIVAEARAAAEHDGAPLADLEHVIVVPLEADPVPDAGAGGIALAQLVDMGAGESVTGDAGGATAVANVFGTSGTTGESKLAMHRQGNITRHARNAATAFGIGAEDVLLCALPLTGVFGFNWAMAGLAAGAHLILQSTFDARSAAEAIAMHGVTHYTAADNMIRPILDVLAEGADLDLSSWRRGGFASFSGEGESLVRDVEAAAGARIGGLYGASECFALMSAWPPDMAPADRARPGGRVISDNIEIRVVDPATGEVVSAGTPGELQVRGYNVTSGYLGAAQATSEAFTEDGWLRTGDLAELVDEHSFVYLSRLKDTLRLRGFLVDPVEIEQTLTAHPAVAQAQVVGASTLRGEVAVAFVRIEPGGDAAPEDLRVYCRERIADFKVPAYIELVDDFPTVAGPNGAKIQKHLLRGLAQKRFGDTEVREGDGP